MSKRTCPHCGATLNSDERASSLTRSGASRSCSACGKPLPSAETSLAHFDPAVDLEFDAFGADEGAQRGEGSDVSRVFEDPFGESDDFFGSHTLSELDLPGRGSAPAAATPPPPPSFDPLTPPKLTNRESGELDFASPGRELSDIDEQDLSLLGTYRVRNASGSTEDRRTDSIWDESGGGRANSGPRARASRPKPLGRDQDSDPELDLGASAPGSKSSGKASRTTSGAASGSTLEDYDPFADMPEPNYGGDTSFGSDPLRGGEDPFAELDMQSKPEPAAKPLDDPFADDPFSDGALGLGEPARPARRTVAPAAEPVFEGAPPVGSRGTSSSRDTMQLNEPHSPASSRSGPPKEETFFIDEPSLGGSVSEDGRVHGADALELEDLPRDTTGSEAAAAQRFLRARGAAPGQSGRGRSRGRGRRRSKGRLFAGLGLLALVGGGAALSLTEYGPFGLDYLFPTQTQTLAPPPPGLQPVARRVVRSDTASGYRTEIESLEREIRGAPTDKKSKRALLALYLEFAARFPAEFERDRSLDARMDELSADVGDAQSPRVRALALMRAGKPDEARVALDQALAMAAEDANLLCLHGDIALEQNDLTVAKQYFTRALELEPGLVRAQYFLGVVAERSNQPEEARKAYERVLELESKHLASRLGLSRLALAAGQIEQAAKEARQVLEMPADSMSIEERFEAHRQLARVAARQQNTDALEEHLTKAVGLRPHNEEAVLELAAHHRKAGRKAQALAALQTCMKDGCDSTLVYEAVAELQLDSDPAEASRLAEEAVERHPADPSAHFLRAEIARGRKQTQAARELYTQLVEKWPDYIEAYVRLADLEFADGHLDRAEETLEAGMRAAPQSTVLLERLALVHEQSGQTVKAIADFRRLVEREPNNTQARLSYAMLLDEAGYSADAVTQFKKLYAQGYTDSKMALAYARALARGGDTRSGIAELERLVESDPQNVGAYTALGKLYVELGSLESAKSELESALRIQPGHAPALVAMGELEEARQNYPVAVRHYQRAVELDPSVADSRIHLARAYDKMGDPDSRRAARTQLDAVIQQAERNHNGRPVDTSVYVIRANLNLALGDYRDALDDVKEALDREPSRIDIQALRGEALYKLKRAGDARTTFESVLDRDQKNAKAHYYLGQMALARGDRAAAEDHLTAAVRAEPERFADAHKTLGFMFRERGLHAQARSQFRAYLDASPDARDRDEVERLLGRLQ